ncbi:hypothetical protein GGI04_000242 [Coemansia thaxteri]|nr:hypothetical protein GGI04_000242 [Coemansia thaxteri]
MDFPAGYIPPFQQPGSTAAPAQDISVYAASSSSPPLAAAELPFAHAAFADGQQISVLSEPDFAKEDSAQPSGDASSRRRGINSSKRAAQNRAAQRAFRLRRERYVTGLEEKARNYDRLEAAYLDMQRENHQLRNRLNKAYSDIAALQTHLASSAPVSPSLAGTIATPFSPATFATSPISGTLAHQHSSSHSIRL